MTMDISIIVPVLNAEATLQACLAGLAAQEGISESVEWIFVDNGSSDASVQILRSDPRVRLLYDKRPGAYSARNHGATVATGRILAFTDPDCVPGHTWLRSMLDTLKKPGIGVALGVRRPSPDTGMNRMLGDYDTTRDEWTLTCGEAEKYYGYTNNMGVNREIWERYGPYDDRPRGADTLFVRRVVEGEGCAAVQFVPTMNVSHLEMDGVRTYLLKMFTYGKSLQSYQRKIRVRPLSMRNRLTVFRETINSKSYGWLQSFALATLLVFGLAAWVAGRLYGHLITL